MTDKAAKAYLNQPHNPNTAVAFLMDICEDMAVRPFEFLDPLGRGGYNNNTGLTHRGRTRPMAVPGKPNEWDTTG